MRDSGIPPKSGAQGFIRKKADIDVNTRKYRHYRLSRQLSGDYISVSHPIISEQLHGTSIGGLVGIGYGGERVPFTLVSLGHPMEDGKAVYSYPRKVSGAIITELTPYIYFDDYSTTPLERVEYWIGGLGQTGIKVEGSNTGRTWSIVDIIPPHNITTLCGRGYMPKPLVRDLLPRTQESKPTPAVATRFWRVVAESALDDRESQIDYLDLAYVDLIANGNHSMRDNAALTTPHHKEGAINDWATELKTGSTERRYPTGLAVDFYNASAQTAVTLRVAATSSTDSAKCFRVMKSDDGINYHTYSVVTIVRPDISSTVTIVDTTL